MHRVYDNFKVILDNAYDTFLQQRRIMSRNIFIIVIVFETDEIEYYRRKVLSHSEALQIIFSLCHQSQRFCEYTQLDHKLYIITQTTYA